MRGEPGNRWVCNPTICRQDSFGTQQPFHTYISVEGRLTDSQSAIRVVCSENAAVKGPQLTVSC